MVEDGGLELCVDDLITERESKQNALVLLVPSILGSHS